MDILITLCLAIFGVIDWFVERAAYIGGLLVIIAAVYLLQTCVVWNIP
jgi:hypothetical protein